VLYLNAQFGPSLLMPFPETKPNPTLPEKRL